MVPGGSEGETIQRIQDYSGRSSAVLKPLEPSPLVSVVIPVRNEEAYLPSTLEQILEQDYPADRLEVLVCDGRSTDRTRDLVRAAALADPRIRLLDNPGERSSSGRNVGFRAARGDVVLVIDGHVHLPSRRLLADLVSKLRDSGADCAGRPQPLRAEPGKPWSAAIALARGSALGHGRDSLIYAASDGIGPAASNGAAYRREIFDRVGFVDESFDACEDLDFNRRIDEAGLRCVHSPALTVEYYARASPGALFAQMGRYGLGRFQYARKDLSRLTPSQLVPVALLLAACAAMLAPLSPTIGTAGALGLALYGCAVLAVSLSLAAKHGWGQLPRLLLVFPTIHFGLGIGFLRGALGRRPTPIASADSAPSSCA